MDNLFSNTLKLDASNPFDLRSLALQKLRSSTANDFLEYKTARCTLGKAFHIPKLQCRLLLLQMSKDGLIYFSKEKIYFKRRQQEACKI